MARGISAAALAPASTDSGGRDASDAALDGAVDPVGSLPFIIHRRFTGTFNPVPNGFDPPFNFTITHLPFSIQVINAWAVARISMSSSVQWEVKSWNQSAGSSVDTITVGGSGDTAGAIYRGPQLASGRLHQKGRPFTFFVVDGGTGESIDFDAYALCKRVG